ncbi:hypothetical protein BDR06DRAFT_1009230 [Suillus hirtellus]|nr:hypothetical protein BDR06DRAFT_1009230 [Suillus hirtellus]
MTLIACLEGHTIYCNLHLPLLCYMQLLEDQHLLFSDQLSDQFNSGPPTSYHDGVVGTDFCTDGSYYDDLLQEFLDVTELLNYPHAPGPGASSSSSVLHTGDASSSIYVLPQSQEFDYFYSLLFLQSLAEPSDPERLQCSRPSSSAPYFIPKPTLITHHQPPPPAAHSFNTSQPVMMTAASAILQPADDSIVPAIVTPHPAIISITPTVQQFPPPVIISISCKVKKRIVDHAK